MADKRQRIKGRKTNGSFMAVPHSVIRSDQYASLSHRAARLLWDVYAQFNGKNNGDLCVSVSIMSKRGWKSHDQLQRARDELLMSGWLIQTRQGGLRMGPNLYAVTFKPVDHCNGKHDYPESNRALDCWKVGSSKTNSPARHTGQTVPPHGSRDSVIMPFLSRTKGQK